MRINVQKHISHNRLSTYICKYGVPWTFVCSTDLYLKSIRPTDLKQLIKQLKGMFFFFHTVVVNGNLNYLVTNIYQDIFKKHLCYFNKQQSVDKKNKFPCLPTNLDCLNFEMWKLFCNKTGHLWFFFFFECKIRHMWTIVFSSIQKCVQIFT